MCLEHVVRNSDSHISANKVQLVRSSEGSQLMKFHDWSVFFQSYFTTIAGITSYRSFRSMVNHLESYSSVRI